MLPGSQLQQQYGGLQRQRCSDLVTCDVARQWGRRAALHNGQPRTRIICLTTDLLARNASLLRSSITAAYSGDVNDPVSKSAVLNHVVLPTTSSATLTSSPNPSAGGQAVPFYSKDLLANGYASGTGIFHTRKDLARDGST